MSMFDPIATAATRVAEHLEPAFAHAEQVAAAKLKLSKHVERRGRLPNFLVFLMDDVGWGDFGCYGGGAAVGAPTPAFDRVAAQGLRLTSCYSEPTCSPSRATLLTGRLPKRHGLHRQPGVIAVSGGPDSVALARLCHHLVRSQRLPRFTLAHLNHQLRGAESDADERFVAALPESWKADIAVTTHQIDIAALARSSGQNLEDTARSARYTWLAETATTIGAAWVAMFWRATTSPSETSPAASSSVRTLLILTPP